MKLYRQFIAVFLSLSVLFLSTTSAFGVSLEKSASDTSIPTFGDGAVYSSEEEWRAAVKENIAADLAAQGIVSSVYFADEPMPLNDIDDYKTVVVETKVINIPDVPEGQPDKGTCFTSPEGGFIGWSPEGGREVDVSVSFVDPKWGLFTVTIDLGHAEEGITSYGTHVPGNRCVLLTTNHEYTISGYFVYKNVWVNDMVGWQWTEWSRNVTTEVTQYIFGYKDA